MNSPPDRSLTEVIDQLTLRLQVLERACGLFPEHYLTVLQLPLYAFTQYIWELLQYF